MPSLKKKEEEPRSTLHLCYSKCVFLFGNLVLKWDLCFVDLINVSDFRGEWMIEEETTHKPTFRERARERASERASERERERADAVQCS